MSAPPGFGSLPPELEDAVLSILEGDDARRDDALRTLLQAEPQHASAILGWLGAAGVPVPDTVPPGAPKPPIDGGAESLPRRIGAYLLQSVLGRGGFGTVYRAQQEEPIQRPVALKILNAGLDSREFLARFAAEREALNRMDHPGIARLLDAGTTPPGRPFFVMELVEGPTLLQYCQRERLPLRRRLDLLLAVLDAMQHAHQKAVLHRDLSSNNVMVADPTGKAQPKIIDFGMAKSLEDPLLLGGAMTMQGTLMGTPEFMSPEQAAGRTADVDTRTDVYSIGVQMYELLTGQLPIPGVVLRAQGVAGLAKIVQEHRVARPSDVAPQGQRAALRGDLDHIVMKALEKAPDERYAGVGEFAADVRRHLDHEPVLAAPKTVWYRLRKYVRRHRTHAIAALLLFAGLIAALIVLWSALSYAHGKAAEAETRRRESEQKANAGFRLLANADALRSAIAAAHELPPPWPQHTAAYTGWLTKFGDPLAEELPKLVATTIELTTAAERSPTGLADASERHLLTALQRLRLDLHEFAKAPTGEYARVSRQLQFLQEVVQPSLRDHQAAWQATNTALRQSDGLGAAHAYRALRLLPQPGLVPLGADPHSKCHEFLDLASHERGFPLPTRDPTTGELRVEAGTGIVFVLLPAGRMHMGARRGDPGMDRNDPNALDNELLGEPVDLDPFCIARTELTAMQWARLVHRALEARDPQLPATGIEHGEAERVLALFGLSLPTEAQWEYACRAGTTTPWCIGGDPAAVAGHASFAGIQLVALLSPNDFGLYDLHGNVAEWCADELLPYADFKVRAGDGLRARPVTPAGAMRAVRGGAFHQGPLGSRSTARDSRPPIARDGTIGLRPVRALVRGN